MTRLDGRVAIVTGSGQRVGYGVALWLIFGLMLSVAYRAPVEAEELQQLTDRLLAPPAIRAEFGFAARVLVPPGHLYDPLFMVPQDAGAWLNDDGGEEKDKGSRLLSIDRQGNISVLAGMGKLLPVTGFDVAPPGFGEYGGQIFALAQGKVAMVGATANHVVQRVDPQQSYAASVFCTLPELGGGKDRGFGAEARFGPQGSPFAGKFYVVVTDHHTIYQVTSDEACIPFVTFDAERVGAPFGLTFAADGNSMLVTVARDDLLNSSAKKMGMIVRVLPNGRVEDRPVARGLTSPSGLALAPATFGIYAGQIFVADVVSMQTPVSVTPALAADGKVYRVTRQGELYTVASGFVNPTSLCFVGNSLWVSDSNGDFSAGKRALLDGFVVTITDR